MIRLISETELISAILYQIDQYGHSELLKYSDILIKIIPLFDRVEVYSTCVIFTDSLDKNRSLTHMKLWNDRSLSDIAERNWRILAWERQNNHLDGDLRFPEFDLSLQNPDQIAEYLTGLLLKFKT